MAILSPSPKLQFFDANGNPLVGGKLYSYTAGTTSPLATYTDSTNTSANTNPIILDSRGEASVWLGSSAYKLVLYSATDILIWSVDNVTSASSDTLLANLAASGGAGLIGYTQGGTGAVASTVQTKLRESVSVKDFGAKGDGVTDDVAAIQAAIDYVNTAGGGTINFPVGVYLLTSTSSVNSAQAHFHLTNAEDLNFIGYGAVLQSTYSNTSYGGHIFNCDGVRRISFEGFDISGIFSRTLSTVNNWSVGVFFMRSSTRDSESICIKNIRVQNVYHFMFVGSPPSSYRVRTFSVENCFAFKGYYGMNFSDNGDNFTATNFRTNGFIRTYFAFGVDSHNVSYMSSGGDVFTDCLIKAYSRATKNISVKARISGNTSTDAKCTIESQHPPSTQPVPAQLSNISVHIDDSDSTGSKSVRFAYYQDTPTPVQTASTIYNLFDNITISGYVRNDFDIAVDQGVAGKINIDNLTASAFVQQTVFNNHGFYRLWDTFDSAGDPDKIVGGFGVISANTNSTGNLPRSGFWSGFSAGSNYSNIQLLKDTVNGDLFSRAKRGTGAWTVWSKHADSEESLWTPTITFGGNAVGMAYTTSAYYKKIGTFAYVWAEFTFSAKGSSTGVAAIGSLPFGMVSYPLAQALFYSGGSGLPASVMGYGDGGTGKITLATQGATGFTNITDANFTNTSRIWVSMSYPTSGL